MFDKTMDPVDSTCMTTQQQSKTVYTLKPATRLAAKLKAAIESCGYECVWTDDWKKWTKINTPEYRELALAIDKI